MRVIIILSILSLSSASVLGDCTLPDKTVIPEGTSKSLFDPGKGLENFKTQDQDGLATCYANASSVMLKTSLPGAPDVSYHHIAMSYAIDPIRNKFKDGKVKYEKKKDHVVEYGFVCDAINTLKKKGGACSNSKSRLENGKLMDPNLQGKYYHGLGKFFDMVNKIRQGKKSEEEIAKLKEEMKVVFDKVKEERKFILDGNCNDQYPAHGTATKVIGDVLQREMAKESPCKPILDAVRTLADPGSNFEGDRALIFSSGETNNKFADLLRQDPHAKAMVDKFFEEKKKPASGELKSAIKLRLQKFFEQEFPPANFKECGSSGSGHPLLSGTEDEVVQHLLDETREMRNSSCDWAKTGESIRDTILDLKEEKNEKKKCKYPHIEVITDAVLPIVELGEELDDEVLEALLDPTYQDAKQFTNILMPECASAEAKIPFDSLTCENVNMCDMGKIQGYKTDNWDGPKGNCYKMDDAKVKFAGEVMKGIDDGRALGIHTCSQFLNRPDKKTDFCRKNSTDSVKGHSFHDMAVTGYRCSGGKIQYELQNSWGKGYCPKQLPPKTPDPEPSTATPSKIDLAKNAAFDCVVDGNGDATGRFWVQEEVLVDATQSLYKMSGGTP